MSFIYDDKKLKFINSGEEFDRRRFFRVRKLFVQYKMAPNVLNNAQRFDEFLVHKFQTYGEIESIDLLSNAKSEAYITSKSELAAYKVLARPLRCHRIPVSMFDVQPAFTWLQPFTPDNVTTDVRSSKSSKDAMDVETEPPPIHQLNDDCLEKIFEYCDLKTKMSILEVNKRFNRLMREYGFRHSKCLRIDRNHFDIWSLLETRKILKGIGKHINKLSIGFLFEEEAHLLRQLHIQKHLGDNIRELNVDLDYFYGEDFEKWCTPWPKLKHVVLTPCDAPYSYKEPPDDIFKRLDSFLKQNPQLECFGFDAGPFNDTHFLTITQRLVNVNALLIGNPFHWRLNLTALPSLQQLTSLELYRLTERDFLHYSPMLSKLVTLLELGIRLVGSCIFRGEPIDDADRRYKYYPKALTELLPNLVCLEKLWLKGSFLEAKTIVDIVRFANQLKRCSVQGCGIDQSDLQLSKKILEARRALGEANGPLELSVDEKFLKQLQIPENDDTKRYLNIHSKSIVSRFD